MRAAIAVGLALAGGTLLTDARAETSPWLFRAGVSDVSPRSKVSTIAAGDVDVDDQLGPTVNLVYFFTPAIAIDMLGGLPFKHDININGVESANAKHLPPVVTLQYHFFPEAQFQPYVGAGVNYTWFYDEHLNDSDANLQIENSFGLAAQGGLDWKIDDHWLAGVDVRWIDVDADVSLDGAALGTVHIEPFVYSLTVGYRF
jgi:outer membrane protein